MGAKRRRIRRRGKTVEITSELHARILAEIRDAKAEEFDTPEERVFREWFAEMRKRKVPLRSALQFLERRGVEIPMWRAKKLYAEAGKADSRPAETPGVQPPKEIPKMVQREPQAEKPGAVAPASPSGHAGMRSVKL